MISLEEDIRKKFGKMQKIAVERLHPPKVETSVATIEGLGGSIEKIPHESRTDSRILGKPIVSETTVSGNIDRNSQSEKLRTETDSKLSIGSLRYRLKWDDLDPTYQEWCLASETYRHYIFTVEGKTSRKTGIEAMDKIGELREERCIIAEIKKIDPNARNMGNVINEFKSKVAKLQEKRVE